MVAEGEARGAPAGGVEDGTMKILFNEDIQCYRYLGLVSSLNHWSRAIDQCKLMQSQVLKPLQRYEVRYCSGLLDGDIKLAGQKVAILMSVLLAGRSGRRRRSKNAHKREL
mmetsp:Transcript_2179/g.4000  ORF Transcript_2179/g.4000 Transcript_2179/m.4000 type:complete len:111 (+) Transcript_2179:3233-3565(+)